MGVTISEPGVYIPEVVLSNADLEKLVDTTNDWIIDRTGMKARRIEFKLDVKQMAIEAVKDLLKRTKIDPGSVDEIVFATNNHEDRREFPAYAGIVCRETGLNRAAAVYDLGAGCTGFVYGIRNAYNAVAVGEKKRIIVIGAERLSSITDYGDRATCILFGDAATAVLVERDDRVGIIKNVVGGEWDIPVKGDPIYSYSNLSTEIKTGKRLLYNDAEGFSTQEETDRKCMYMYGKGVFKFAAVAMKSATSDILQGTEYTFKDIKAIVPHGANFRITDNAHQDIVPLGFDGIVYTTLEKYGNPSTASIGLSFREAIDRGAINDGDLCVFVAFGAGFTFGANLFIYRKRSS